MEIAILLFDRITALDAIGPYEVLARIPGARVRFVGHRRGEVRTDSRALGLTVDARFEEVAEPAVVVVPGGHGSRALIDDHRLHDWLRAAHRTSRYTTSVCTGSLVLAAAGLLDGVDATTHWTTRELLASLGARPIAERVVERGRLITAAGVSAGIDMGLTLAARLAGDQVARAIQLGIEYDPQPPFDAGNPDRLDPAFVDRVRALAARDGAASEAR